MPQHERDAVDLVRHVGNHQVVEAATQVAEAGENGGGLGDFLAASTNVARAAGALTRRLTIDLAETTVVTGIEVARGVRQGRSSAELATAALNGCIEGAKKVLGFDEELQRMGSELRNAAKPMAQYVPDQVREVAQQVADIAPVKAVTGRTGLTAGDIRRNLRQKGSDLLTRSTALDDPDEHPALAAILDELSPDEARVMRFLGECGPQAVIDVIAHNPMTRKRRELVHYYSLVGRESGCIRPERAPIYLDNLERLGLVAVRQYRLRSQRNYDLLSCQPEVQDLAKPRGKLVRLKVIHKGVELSEFGKEMFCRCLETESSRLAAVPDEL